MRSPPTHHLNAQAAGPPFLATRFARVLLAALLATSLPLQAAAPPAGAEILNRAEASYVPPGNTGPETLYSNVVAIEVAAVESLALVADQTVSRLRGAPIVLPHVVTNTGNVASQYRFTLANLGGDAYNLSNLQLVHDLNGNGDADPGEPVLAIDGTTPGLELAAGAAASLLVLAEVPLVADGSAQIGLTATTASATPLSAVNTDTVGVEDLADVILTKGADQSGNVYPGTTIRYRVVASNAGDRPAAPTDRAGPLDTPVLIDGQPASVFLITDHIPPGTIYVPGSVVTSLPAAIPIYRLPADPAYSYRTNGDDVAAVEVGVASTLSSLAPDATTELQFAVRVRDGYTGSIVNVARSFYDNGRATAESVSNAVTLEAPVTAIGLSKRAAPPVLEGDPATGRIETARVRLSFVLQNSGAALLRDAQVTDLLEGGARFGRYVQDQTPDAGAYTIVSGSGSVVAASGGAAGEFDERYDGTSAHATLLEPGTLLPAGATLEIAFDVRYNLAGRPPVIENTATAQALPEGAGGQLVTDDSVDGAVPDRNGNGNPGDDTSPTLIEVSLPRLSLEKSAGVPQRIAGESRRYAIDYAVTVTNTGDVPATFVQVIDNLECTFGTQQSGEAVRAWRLAAAPVAERGLLTINPAFTGAARCATPADLTNLRQALAADPAVALTDGSRHLNPGDTEVIRFTVQIDVDPLAPAAERTFDNLAITMSSDRSDGSGFVLAAARDDVAVTPVDPRGVVYDSTTRQPVAGAVVTLVREACDAGGAGPITPEQLLPVPGVTYSFDADGSVSMTTGADGVYLFQLSYPPLTDTCRYGLAIRPPTAGPYVWPSVVLPPDPGVAPGGLIQPQEGPPTGSDSTLYYLRFNLGPMQPEVLNNHVPLDPAPPPSGLLLEKLGSRSVLAIGDSVDYVLRLGIAATAAIDGVRIIDQLPPGFRYVPGSARLGSTSLPDPAGAPGPELVFELPGSYAPGDDAILLGYRAVAGVDTPHGPAVNRATAYARDVASNEAAWRVRVEGGVFADEAYLVGKVFLDSNRDGIQGHEEIGVPGVRLLLEDGTSVVTDVEGKYSLYGLRAITHVLKLDTTTLPSGAQPLLIDNRNSGRADSRFVDLKNGELHKANFAIEDCCTSGVRDEVERRRKELAFRPDAEGETVTRVRLALDAQPERTLQDARSRAASGELGPSGIRPMGTTAAAAAGTVRAAVYDPMLPADSAESAPSGLPTPPAAALPTLDLESLVAGTDNTLGYVGLVDGDTLPLALTHVAVKGRLGATLQLTVNGAAVPMRRVGKKVAVAARQLEAWQYIGVELLPGENVLQLDEVDGFGNVRDSRRITLMAPGAAGRIEVEAPRTAAANPGSPVRVRVRLTDDHGVPVTVRTPLTLEAETGRWEPLDLNPDEPGTQVYIAGGEAEFALVPPNEPQDAIVRASSGMLSGQARIAFLPELRPLIGAGMLEGIIDLRGKGAVPLGRARGNTFEQELRNLSHESDDGNRELRGRAAFYFKGTVRGSYLLTAAFDSDKDTRERLFRDIQPDLFYPIYGDSAVKSFDAQSTQRLYVRIDRERSFLLYGDFASEGTDEVRQLGAYNRALTGLRYHHENDRVSANVFGSHDSLRQVVIEIPADGTSGPYQLRGPGEFYGNGERIEILVRDRNQSAIVLQTIPLARFVDYVIEPLSKRILFKAPVASLDANLNPRFIRVTYEADRGGPEYWTAGADARVKVHERVELGASLVRDDNPENPMTLVGMTAVARPTDGSAVIAELAQTDTRLAGQGLAGRIEWLKQDGDLRVRAQVTTADRSFDNTSSGFSGGRTEATAMATYELDAKSSIRAEAVHSRDLVAGGERTGALLTVSTRLTPTLTAEAGVRASTETATPADPATAGVTPNDLLTLRGRLSTQLPSLNDGQVYVEAEQDVRVADKRMLALGGDYPLVGKTRLYGRYEFLSSLGNPYTLNTTQQNNIALIGIDSAYLQQGRIFSELRLRDAISGREGQAASGVRNVWTLRDGLNLGASLEHTAAFGGVAGNNSAAATTSLEYNGSDRYKLYGSLEARDADSGDAYLNTLGMSLKLDKDWSLLGRSALSIQHGNADDTRVLLSRQQLGVAWRQVDVDRWNALGRYEYNLSETDGGTEAAREDTHIVSLHANYQPTRELTGTARYAFKWGREQRGGLESRFHGNLLYGRLTWDFAQDWDLSPQVAYRWGQDGEGSHAFGLELGYQLMDNLWLSVGHNVTGFNDPALAGSDQLERGTYLRIRFKFDEGLLR
ncbi:MAG: hypothetical protein WBM03_15530 [Steroidobacteraceae bacterium]